MKISLKDQKGRIFRNYMTQLIDVKKLMILETKQNLIR